MKANPANYPEQLTEKESGLFWMKVDKAGPWPLQKNCQGKCWTWTAGRVNEGYGRFYLRGGKPLAHRLSYVLRNGSVGDELKIDHLCRNRSCVNPDHLEPVTDAVNTRRGRLPLVAGKSMLARTHCPRGHLLNAPNLRADDVKHGRRGCLSCARTRSKYHDFKRRGIILDPDDFRRVSDAFYREIMGPEALETKP